MAATCCSDCASSASRCAWPRETSAVAFTRSPTNSIPWCSSWSAASASAATAPMSRTFVSRSEEHTSELQSQSNLVCRLLLEKKYESLGVPVVKPDMVPAEFEAGWRHLSLWLRLSVLALVPVYALRMMLFGSREVLARRARTDDLSSPEDVMEAADERLGPLVELIGDDRDACLLAALERIHDERCHEPIQVAVVYGAAHMGAVVSYLGRRLGYWARDAEWLTVFDL